MYLLLAFIHFVCYSKLPVQFVNKKFIVHNFDDKKAIKLLYIQYLMFLINQMFSVLSWAERVNSKNILPQVSFIGDEFTFEN